MQSRVLVWVIVIITALVLLINIYGLMSKPPSQDKAFVSMMAVQYGDLIMSYVGREVTKDYVISRSDSIVTSIVKYPNTDDLIKVITEGVDLVTDDNLPELNLNAIKFDETLTKYLDSH